MSDSPYFYISEIRDMMYGYGDAKNPLVVSAQLLEHIVYSQMRALIEKASEAASLRGFSTIGHEDILFLMRKNRVKIRRLLKYLEIKDMKSNLTAACDKGESEIPVNDGSENEMSSVESDVEEKPKQQKVSRVDKCKRYLNFIDNSGELCNVFEDSSIYDEEKLSRLNRQNKIALMLNADEYLEFHKARQAGFHESCTFKKSKFKMWLYRIDNCNYINMTTTAFEMICYLAQETVATIVSACLKIKEEKKDKGSQTSTVSDTKVFDPRTSNFFNVQKTLLRYTLIQDTKHIQSNDDETNEDDVDRITPHDIFEIVYDYYGVHRLVDADLMPDYIKNPTKFFCL